MIENLWQDVKYAARTLRKNPGYTLAAAFALSLGIGANTTMFSVVNAVLLNSRPLRALREPERVVMIWEKNPALDTFLVERCPVAQRSYVTWKKESRSFEAMSLAAKASFTLTANADLTGLKPAQVDAARATADFFPMLGIQPRIGRNFVDEEMQPGKGRVAILSDEAYRTRFHSDPRILQKRIRADAVDYQVVGVLPAGFRLPAMWEGFDEWNIEIWTPVSLGVAASEETTRSNFVYGRLKPGVTLARARAELAAITKRLVEKEQGWVPGSSANVFPISVEDVSPTMRRSLFVLQVAVAFELLIACANVANLLLTRAVGREREIAIRVALGAGRWRIIRQTLTESLMLSALGGAVGLLLAVWGTDLVAAFAPEDTHGFRELRLDPLVVGFTALATLLAGVLFGLAPALRSARGAVNDALRRGSRSVTGTSARLRGALVVTEIALSFVLLIGAGLMIRSLASIMSVDQGFRVDHLLAARITLPTARYSKPEQVTAFDDRLLEAARRLPGVRFATLANGVPMRELAMGNYEIPGRPTKPGEVRMATVAKIREDYFQTLGIRLVRGRALTRHDLDAPQPTPIMVNESFAKQNWPGEDALGKIVMQDDNRAEIIGIVADAHQMGPDAAVRPQIFYPDAHMQGPLLMLRTIGEPKSLASAVEKLVWSLDKEQPVSSIMTMEESLRGFTSARRFNMTVLIAFATLALVLAAVGLYSVLAYSVTLRTRELGIRMALGAEPVGIARLVVSQGFLLALLGVALGLAGALGLTQLLRSLIYGVSATDPYTFAGVAVLLIGVAVLASYLPARRAARVDPMEALRVE